MTLSTEGQIAIGPQVATLADGTVLAAWENAISYRDDVRVEVAIREAGDRAFLPGRPLPIAAWRGTPALAAGGPQAAVAWLAPQAGRRPQDRSRVLVSSLRTSPPYAKPALRTRTPSTPCDE